MKRISRVGSILIGILCIWGAVMASEIKKEQISHWVQIVDEKNHIKIDFPQDPLEMSFDIPFQNTPPKGTIHLYSVPTPSGLLVLSTYQSNEVSANWFNKEKLIQFFDKVLVPHFFYQPKVFHTDQHFKYQPKTIDKHPGAEFQINYIDHDHEKQLKGYAFVKDHCLCIYFYLSSSLGYDDALLEKFHASLITS